MKNIICETENLKLVNEFEEEKMLERLNYLSGRIKERKEKLFFRLSVCFLGSVSIGVSIGIFLAYFITSVLVYSFDKDLSSCFDSTWIISSFSVGTTLFLFLFVNEVRTYKKEKNIIKKMEGLFKEKQTIHKLLEIFCQLKKVYYFYEIDEEFIQKFTYYIKIKDFLAGMQTGELLFLNCDFTSDSVDVSVDVESENVVTRIGLIVDTVVQQTLMTNLDKTTIVITNEGFLLQNKYMVPKREKIKMEGN